MSRRFWLAASLFLLLAAAVPAEEPRRLKVLTSIPPLYSWAANVAGSYADVENLLPADVGPHDYQFRPRDLGKLKSADLILLNGLGLESWFAKAITANDPKAARKVIEVATGLPKPALIFEVPMLDLGGGDHHDDDHGHGAHGAANPHLWLDPVLAKHAVTNLLAALQQADPAHATGYAANAAAYLARLDALDAELRAGLAKLSHRDLVTFHDAFPYFCRRYGLDLVGVIEEVPGASPSPRYLAALSKIIREHGIGAIFTEPQFDARLARQLAADLKIGVAQLNTLETAPLTPEGYEEGMRANLRVLQATLK